MDVEHALEIAERLSNFISMALSVILVLTMLGDILGISIIEAIRAITVRPFVIPKEIIEAYYPLWVGMEFVLLGAMLYDQVFTMRYMQAHKELPPPEYARVMSFLMFFLSFWLFLIFRKWSFALIAVFSAISLAYTLFARRVET